MSRKILIWCYELWVVRWKVARVCRETGGQGLGSTSRSQHSAQETQSPVHVEETGARERFQTKLEIPPGDGSWPISYITKIRHKSVYVIDGVA